MRVECPDLIDANAACAFFISGPVLARLIGDKFVILGQSIQQSKIGMAPSIE